MGKKHQYNFSIRNKLRYNETWKQRILAQNPWLMEDLYKEREAEPLLFEDQAHLDSIKQEARE